MTQNSFVTVGKVAKAHGLKGEVSVVPATGAPFSLLEGVEVWFAPPSSAVSGSVVTQVRPGPKGPLVRFADIGDISGAQAVAGCELLARTASLPAEWLAGAPDDEDHVGYTVSDVAVGDLGSIVEVIVTGANDVWVVDGPKGEVLIPVIDDVVLEIDDESRHIRVRLLEGLLP